MRKIGLCCRPVSVRLSVRLSVRASITLVHCIHTAEDIVILLVRPGSPITLVFWTHAPIHNSKGNPFSGGAKIHEGGKNWRFSTEISVCLGNGARWANGYYGTLIGNYRWRIYTYGF